MPGEWYSGYFLDNKDTEHWKAQWARVSRWFERINQTKTKNKTTDLDAYDFDDLIAFFQNAYTLREWILRFRPDLQYAVNDFFDKNLEMKACRDICNGFKHIKLEKPSLDKDFKIVHTYDYLETMGTNSSENPIKYHFAFDFNKDIQKYDVFDLVERCYNLWENFISKYANNK